MAIRVTAPVRIDISAGWTDSPPFRDKYGGVVFNAAVDLEGSRISATFNEKGEMIVSPGNIPSHSGLGTSGSLHSVEIALQSPDYPDYKNLAKKVWMHENIILEQRGGIQDQLAAIVGGVNLWALGKGSIEAMDIKQLAVSKPIARALEDMLVLVYTGDCHLSSSIHQLVFGDEVYKKNIPKIDRMSQIATFMYTCLTGGAPLTDLIRETWDLQKSLHPSIETEKMRVVQERLKGSYLACKATGAGGGGSMVFYTDDKENLSEKVNKIQLPGVRVLPFEFDYEGIKIEKI